ncbi:MAG: zinc/manganese transport system substrate-binding protein [Frankiaceae bacterium]|nr:zinc/manganese transport system substrate-binding protein [Frankiaceae bacterium]
MSARLLPALCSLALAASACAVAPAHPAASRPRVVEVVASISAWGSILAQLGGVHVHETAIITNPNADPHDYEPTPADGRTIAAARLLVVNGIGYDGWASKAAAANPDSGRRVIDVGEVVHVPTGGNPHRWYSPADVTTVADAITAALQQVDPADAPYFAARRTAFETQTLAPYHRLIGAIKAAYGGTPIGASESIVAPLAAALGLDLLTPPSFLRAISEGAEPSAADKSVIDRQIATGRIKVYVVNVQNSTPDVTAQVRAARARGIPVVSVTETLTPSTATFQDWQVAQLSALQAALRQATGR